VDEPVLALEPIDAPESQALLGALWEDLGARYADIDAVDDSGVDFGRDAYLADVRPDQVVAPHGAFVVVRCDGVAVACGAVRSADQPGLAEIKRMYVMPEHRGRGLSRAVLARLEDEAAALGYARLRLETGIAQPEAMALYESAGWTPTEPWPPWDRVAFSRCYAKDIGGSTP
jgi:GNAT superfamily N-acetyltransferase